MEEQPPSDNTHNNNVQIHVTPHAHRHHHPHTIHHDNAEENKQDDDVVARLEHAVGDVVAALGNLEHTLEDSVKNVIVTLNIGNFFLHLIISNLLTGGAKFTTTQTTLLKHNSPFFIDLLNNNDLNSE